MLQTAKGVLPMKLRFSRTQIALAVSAALGATAMSVLPGIANAEKDRDRDRDRGTYVSGDFHNHTTCSDGSISMQKLVKRRPTPSIRPGAWTGSCRPATATAA